MHQEGWIKDLAIFSVLAFMMSEKWVHAIPAVVLLCLFTLWWFSFPGA
jgi:hypothetical protein